MNEWLMTAGKLQDVVFSHNVLVILILWPMLTGVALLFFQRKVEVQRTISAVSTVTGFLFSLILAWIVAQGDILVLHVGQFTPPFGIILVGDRFAATMLVMTMLIATAVLLFAFSSIDREREKHYFYPFFQFLLMGVNGAFLTGDLFNLFVWFEVLLIASYVLVALGGEPDQLQEGFKYVIVNVVSSALFLVAVAALYSSIGTLNMADIAQKTAEVGTHGILRSVYLLFMVVFGIKAAIFPLYFWLPRTYEVIPTAVIAFFGGVMTKVGVYAMMRLSTLIFPAEAYFNRTLFIWLAGITMVVGILGTIIQMDFKRILAWHIISQIGYMIMGLGLFTPLGLAAAIYYIVHVAVVKSGLFLVSGVTEKLTGTTHLEKMSGVGTTHPALGALFVVGGLSLVGVPPSSGFFGKFGLVTAGLDSGRYGIVLTAIAVSLFTLYSMIKIYRKSFWGTVTAPRNNFPLVSWAMPAVMLIAFSVGMGLFAQFVVSYAGAAAEQLMTPALYIEAVFAGGGL